jgi:hypothetical protein
MTDGLLHPSLPAGGPDDGVIYAMKSLRKEVLLRRNQIEHTKTERAILEGVNHPFIVGLRYAFQTQEKLYLVTGACAPCECARPCGGRAAGDTSEKGAHVSAGGSTRQRNRSSLTKHHTPGFAAGGIIGRAMPVGPDRLLPQ